MKKNLFLIGIILISIMAVQNLEAQKKTAKKETVKVDPEFEKFWNEFKEAFIANDIDKLCSMTNFPVQYGQQHQISDGEYDMKKVKLSKSQFQKKEAGTFGDEYIINTLKTQKVFIKYENKYISCSYELDDGGSIEFQFKLFKSKYKLVYFMQWQYS